METYPISLSLRAGTPDFLDLPWHLPVSEWSSASEKVEEMPRGLSRHPVVFLNYSGEIYAFKEMPGELAEREYTTLLKIEELRLPAVTPSGHAATLTHQGKTGILITRYLEQALPYRILFQSRSLERYREHLLDAMAGLMVQLHLAGIYWGDCSLSNTLFRRDAGALSAYLVDAETAEISPDRVPPALRHQDLVIMEENIDGDLAEIEASGVPLVGNRNIHRRETGAYIRLRYQQLWEEITREEVINPGETYRIQERIRALNDLGFSVGEIALREAGSGNQLRLKVVVTDRSFHHDQLQGLTGIVAEERQAREMMNEIQQVKAMLSQRYNRNTPLSTAAYYWMEKIYQPAARQLDPLVEQYGDLPELYCQVLEHKWFLSEQAHHDVGHQAAIEDFIHRFGKGA